MPGAFNRYLSKTLNMLETATGSKARKWENRSQVFKDAENQRFTPKRAERMATVEKGRTFQARVKGAVGGAVAAGTGFLGVHKYYQHQDNKILERIDKMYGPG